jgi:hypothetical protein
MINLFRAVLLAVLSLAASNVFCAGLLPAPSISINDKICMTSEKRIVVADMPSPDGRQPTTEDNVRGIWRQLKEAKFECLEGCPLSLARTRGAPVFVVVLSGRISIKIGNYWSFQYEKLMFRRDDPQVDSWRIDFEAMKHVNRKWPKLESPERIKY